MDLREAAQNPRQLRSLKCDKLIRHQNVKHRARVAVASEAGQASTDRSQSGAYLGATELVHN